MGNGVLVHEWLEVSGGAEMVYEAMAEAFPDADLLCLWVNDERRFPGRVVRETALARTPLRRSKVAALPLMPLEWRRQRGDYDWALVSSHLFAHHVTFAGAPASFRKYVYVHTPARYIWVPDLDGRGNSLPVRLASAALRPLDRRRAQEAHSVAANSEYIRSRIQRVWGRDARVIYPPVEVASIQRETSWKELLTERERQLLDSLPEQFILGASRFVPYKALDRVIEIGEQARVPVVIAGGGPLEGEMLARARASSVPVTVVVRPSSELLYALYQAAAVHVFPPVEDFGIMPVEAHAAGCPTLVNSVGGAAESTTDGVTGAVVDMSAPASVIREGLERAMRADRETCRMDARRFSREVFISSIRDWVLSEEPLESREVS